ncbi:hypothetical protein AB5N19_07219 [Seiridium cardinale]|uniref:Uncharacterized protein n=1 Tax=Seiridium cardinale TaxID=138064 RepID=A0ABR2Y3Y2_9PEZI
MGKDEYTPSAERVGDQGSGKGKGKEAMSKTTNPDELQIVPEGAPESPLSRDASALSRITSSALALGSSLLSKPDIAGHAPSDKAGSASSSNLQHPLGEASTYGPQTGLGSGSSIRSTHVQDHVEREEAAFSRFLEGSDVPNPSSYDSGHVDSGGWSVEKNPLDHGSQDYYLETDGKGVVDLLDNGYEEVMHAEPDAFLSREQEASLRRALFGSDDKASQGAGITSDWTSLLNFVPEYISNGSTVRGNNELQQHLGMADALEASKIWADQWSNVLSRYTDEVWGDLAPLIREAKGEAQKIQQNGLEATPSEAKAILRLRQILSHVQASQ